MQLPAQYRLQAALLPGIDPEEDRVYGIDLVPSEQPGVRALFRGFNGDSEIAWPRPIALEDCHPDRLLIPIALLAPAADGAVQTIMVDVIEEGGDSSSFFLHEPASREWYRLEVAEAMFWPATWLQLSVDRDREPVFTSTFQRQGSLWECSVQLYSPQRWSPEILSWVFTQHLSFSKVLAQIDWQQAVEVFNRLAQGPMPPRWTPRSSDRA